MNVLYVKNMVSDECMKTVNKLLTQVGLEVVKMGPGRVDVSKSIEEGQKETIRSALKRGGFSLIEHSDTGLVSQIKCIIRKAVHHRKEGETVHPRFSSFLAEEFDVPYTTLNRLFSRVEGEPIGDYLAKEKVERAKELMKEDPEDYNTTDISIDLGYKHPSALCMHFKQITGMTPTIYRSVGMVGRKRFPSHKWRLTQADKAKLRRFNKSK